MLPYLEQYFDLLTIYIALYILTVASWAVLIAVLEGSQKTTLWLTLLSAPGFVGLLNGDFFHLRLLTKIPLEGAITIGTIAIIGPWALLHLEFSRFRRRPEEKWRFGPIPSASVVLAAATSVAPILSSFLCLMISGFLFIQKKRPNSSAGLVELPIQIEPIWSRFPVYFAASSLIVIVGITMYFRYNEAAYLVLAGFGGFGLLAFLSTYFLRTSIEVDESGLTVHTLRGVESHSWSDISSFRTRYHVGQVVLEAMAESPDDHKVLVHMRLFGAHHPHELKDFLNTALGHRK